MKFLFYNPIKVSGSDDDILFWSDCHFGHRCDRWPIPLWKMRGFDSVEQHDQGLIDRWNQKSNPNSIFFHLGDFIFGADTIQRFQTTIEQLNFNTLYIMPGNHCSGWKQNFEFQNQNVWNINANKRVIFIPNYVEVVANRQPIVLSHFPLASFNGQGIGSWMLHGHCHGKLYDTPIGQTLYQAKIKDVGIERETYPATLKELRSVFGSMDNVNFER